LIRNDASEISEELTSTSVLFFAFRILLSSSDNPISFFFISFVNMSIIACIFFEFVIAIRSSTNTFIFFAVLLLRIATGLPASQFRFFTFSFIIYLLNKSFNFPFW